MANCKGVKKKKSNQSFCVFSSSQELYYHADLLSLSQNHCWSLWNVTGPLITSSQVTDLQFIHIRNRFSSGHSDSNVGCISSGNDKNRGTDLSRPNKLIFIFNFAFVVEEILEAVWHLFGDVYTEETTPSSFRELVMCAQAKFMKTFHNNCKNHNF